MKKFLFLLFMALPLSAHAAEHGGKAMPNKAPANQTDNKAAEHAGQALKKKCDPSSEACGQPMQSKAPSDHGGTPAKKKTDEHGGTPMK